MFLLKIYYIWGDVVGILNLFKKEKSASELPPPPPPLRFEEISSELKIPASLEQQPEIPTITAADLQTPSPSTPTLREQPIETSKHVADRTIQVQEELVPRPPVTTPVFVSAHDYNLILSSIQAMRTTLADSENTIIRLGEIKTAQDRIFSDWKIQLSDMEKKLNYIDTVIFSGE